MLIPGDVVHTAISEEGHGFGAGSNLILMRDKHKGDALAVQVIEEIKHVLGGAGVESSCGFIRKQ